MIPAEPLILEEGLTMSGRCVQGFNVGWICNVTRETFRIRWLRAGTTEHKRDSEKETERMKVWVVMSNDYPHSVFASQAAAEQFVESKNREDKAKYPYREVFWRHYEFDVRKS